MKKLQSHFPMVRRALATLLALCGLVGCVIGKYPPEDFFTGPSLELARAIRRGDSEADLRRLAAGLDLQKPGQKRMTLIWFAIQEQNFTAIKTLVALGVDPDKQTAPGIGSALDFAIYQKDLRFLTAMLDGGLSPNYHEEYKATLLQRAAGPGGSLEHVKLVLSRGANVNLRDSIGGTALNEATASLQPDIAIYLVEHGAGVNFCTSNGVSTAWSVHLILKRQKPGTELYQKFERLRELMIQKGAKFPPDPPEVVRDQMRAQGLTPAVPPGRAK